MGITINSIKYKRFKVIGMKLYRIKGSSVYSGDCIEEVIETTSPNITFYNSIFQHIHFTYMKYTRSIDLSYCVN